MFRIRTFIVGIVAAGALAGASVLAAPGANAAGSGNCADWGDGSTGAGGDACVYYHPQLTGGFYGNQFKINYQGKTFGGCSNNNCQGDGQSVRNNAASVADQDYSCTVVIQVYPLGTANNPFQEVGPLTWADLNSTLRNNNASQVWLGPGSCSG